VLTCHANELGSMIGMAIGFCANAYTWQGAAMLRWLQRVTAAPFAMLALSRADSLPLVRADRQRDYLRRRV
jgi:hypothetical protein